MDHRSISQYGHTRCVAKHINGANVDTNVPPVASHIRKKIAGPLTQRKHQETWVNHHQKQISQQEEIGQRISRGGRIIRATVEKEEDIEINPGREVNHPGR